jgi:hypothetical protein
MDDGAIGVFSSMVIRRLLKHLATRALRRGERNSGGIAKGSDYGMESYGMESTQALIGDRVLIRYFNVLKENGLI